MPKLLIPVTLKRRSELGHRLAMRAKTQAEVDRITRIFMPEWRGEQPDTFDPGVTKLDGKQSAGDYSLDLCQGGARYHVPDPTPRRVATFGVAKVKASVAVPDDLAHPPIKRPRKRVPKSYLKDRPKPEGD